MKYLLFLFFFYLGLQTKVTAQTYCLNYDILSLTTTQIVVKVSVSGSTAFNLGDANLVLNFNANALSAPNLVSTTVTNRFSPPTVTNPANGVASINLDYNGGVGQGLAVATTPTEVAVKLCRCTVILKCPSAVRSLRKKGFWRKKWCKKW